MIIMIKLIYWTLLLHVYFAKTITICAMKKYTVMQSLIIYTISHPHQINVLQSALGAAEATCVSAIRSARGLVNDLGADLAARSPGIVQVSKLSEAHSERGMHNLLDQYGLGLEIPFTQLPLDTDQNLDIPVLRLRDWASFLLEKNAWHLVCGLVAPNAKREEDILRAFWNRFRKQHPTHSVFEMADRGEVSLERVAPFVMHGDEGRGLKRQAYMVMNFHSCLGRGTNPERRRNAKQKLRNRYIKHKLNFRGHSYCHRFLFGCMPKSFYTNEHEGVFDSMLSMAASEAMHMAVEGVIHPRTKERYWILTLGITGDWPWLGKSGDLNRTFNHVQKRRSVRNPPSGICHLCLAGRNNIPYEQVQTRRPGWYDTMFQQDPFNSPSPFRFVPHVNGQFPSFWKFDVFHCWHLGVAKQFLGSILAILSTLQAASGVDERFSLLTQHFLEWCRLKKKTPSKETYKRVDQLANDWFVSCWGMA